MRISDWSSDVCSSDLFIVLHYAANAREGEPLWDHLRHMTLPDSLAHKIELYRESAIAPDYALGLFSRDSWLSVFEGQGIVPRAYSPLAERLPLPELQRRLNDLARSDEHTSELQSLMRISYAVFCLKKKKKTV